MSDDKEFWKELLGDDYDGQVMDAIDAEAQNRAQETPDSDDLKHADDFADSFFDQPEADAEPTEIAHLSKSQPQADVPEADCAPAPLQEEQGADMQASATEDSPATPPQKPENTGEFDVDFDFEHAYTVPKSRPLVRRSGVRRLGISGGILYAFFILAVSAILAATGWLAATDVLGFGGTDEAVTVTVEKDFDIDSVTDMLYSNGLIKYKPLFKFYANFSHAEEKISSGTYVLNKEYDYRALVNGMTSSGGTRVVVTVTIPEGYSLQQTIELLEANNVCAAEDLWDAAANFNFEYDFLSASTIGQQQRLEGFLFPDTYDFYLNDSASRVLNKMLDNFSSRWTQEMRERAQEMGYSIQEIVNIAAMIEEEAGDESERADIASVIYNRLEIDMPLQMDSTITYIIASTGQAFSTEIESPYNTYLHAGLPAGPISNPGMSSITAALYPNDTDYYYFAVDTDGKTRFFQDHSSFEAFVNSDEYIGNAEN